MTTFYMVHTIQWNSAKADAIGTMRQRFVHCSKVSLAQGVIVVDHAPLTVMADYDEARLYG